MSRSERGVTEVTLTSLDKLVRGLGLTILEFFAFEDEPDADKAVVSADIQHVVALLTNAPPLMRERVVRSLDALLAEPRGDVLDGTVPAARKPRGPASKKPGAKALGRSPR